MRTSALGVGFAYLVVQKGPCRLSMGRQDWSVTGTVTAWVPAWRTRPSKSRRKAQMHELQSLGDTLVGLTDNQFASVPLPEDLRDAVKAARGMTRLDEARRRQLQYIGKVIRGVDAEPLREAVASFQLGHAQNALTLHEAERWRAERAVVQLYLGE